MRSYTAATFVAVFSLASAQIDLSSLDSADVDAISQCAEPCLTSVINSFNCDLSDYNCLCSEGADIIQQSASCLSDKNCIPSGTDISSIVSASKAQLDQVCNELSASNYVATSDGNNSSFNGTSGATATGSAGSATATGSSGTSGGSGSAVDTTSSSKNSPVTTSAGCALGVRFSLAAVTVGLAAVLTL